MGNLISFNMPITWVLLLIYFIFALLHNRIVSGIEMAALLKRKHKHKLILDAQSLTLCYNIFVGVFLAYNIANCIYLATQYQHWDEIKTPYWYYAASIASVGYIVARQVVRYDLLLFNNMYNFYTDEQGEDAYYSQKEFLDLRGAMDLIFLSITLLTSFYVSTLDLMLICILTFYIREVQEALLKHPDLQLKSAFIDVTNYRFLGLVKPLENFNSTKIIISSIVIVTWLIFNYQMEIMVVSVHPVFIATTLFIWYVANRYSDKINLERGNEL